MIWANNYGLTNNRYLNFTYSFIHTTKFNLSGALRVLKDKWDLGLRGDVSDVLATRPNAL